MRRLGRFRYASVFVALLAIGAAAAEGQQSAQNAILASNVSAPAPTASLSTAQSSVPSTDDIAGRPELQHRDPRYRLCASDVLGLTFASTPEFDQAVNIQPDGFISLAAVGDVHVEGMTTAEASTAIKAAYSKILEQPALTIELKDYNKPYFMVNGQVYKPGKFELRGYTTASQAITMAGGFQDTAKHSQVLLFRRVNDAWYEVKLLDMKKILQGHDVNEDPEIRPGDLLFVPQNLISKIKKFIPNYGMGAYSEFHP
jgi:protein involved in polysaccharide export with SLBB domain